MSDSITTVYVALPAEYVVARPDLMLELEAQARHAVCKMKTADIEEGSVIVQFSLSYSPTKVVSGRWYVPERAGTTRNAQWVNAVSDDLAQSFRRCLKQFKFEPGRVVFTGKLDNIQYTQGIA